VQVSQHPSTLLFTIVFSICILRAAVFALLLPEAVAFRIVNRT
jgi:hypothetical protein